MSYQSLYRKYRSQSFSDMVGQEAMSRALRGAIAGDRVAHAYLFSGSRGTGKTTTARLLAKAVNCLRRQPGTAEPCNQCESCAAITTGSALDLIEIDAASNRGIDEIRDLREKVNLAPALGRRKVYIIDEAHMLTPEAFNALLKTLEEPPQHVVFVLCTTEANKIPLTVLGRCQQFLFRRFSDDQVIGRLEHVAHSEGIVVERPALELIAHVAQGSMRDALGLLDQLVPLAQGPITLAGARELLGVADPALIDGLLDHVLEGRAGAALEALGRMYEGGSELRQVVRGLMERCRDRLVQAIEARDAALRERMSGVLDALLHLDGEVRRHAEPRFLVEATLVRLAVEAVPAPAVAPAVTSAEPVEPALPAPVVAAPVPTSPMPTSPAATAAARSGDAEGWRHILDSLKVADKAKFRDARPLVDGTRLVLSFQYAFHHSQAMANLGLIEALVKEWLGPSATIETLLQESTPRPGPTVSASPPRPLAPEEDPIIKAAERKLEARVVRVRPAKEASS